MYLGYGANGDMYLGYVSPISSISSRYRRLTPQSRSGYHAADPIPHIPGR